MPVTKAPAFVPGYTWTGFYAGINGGYGWGSSDWNGFLSDTDVSGGLVGLTAGYNWQTGALVFGLEGDIDWSNIRGSFASATCPIGCETKNNWLGTVRGRIGYAFDRVMPYVTGGLAVGDIKASRAGFVGASDTNAGWTIGGGVEGALVRQRDRQARISLRRSRQHQLQHRQLRRRRATSTCAPMSCAPASICASKTHHLPAKRHSAGLRAAKSCGAVFV